MTPSIATRRVNSIDILRGIIMVIMALDHTRDFFSGFYNDPTDLVVASTPMFLTRWITHYCAPVFVFFSGVSAFLSFSKGKTTRQASLFLLSRGIWLIILELTLVRIGWQFNFDYSTIFVQVIWALGWSMICLALLVYLPKPLILTIGIAMIAGHNMLDSIHAADFGTHAIWWNIFHEFGYVNVNQNTGFMVIYPLVPWIGVMATGYCFGSIFKKDEGKGTNGSTAQVSLPLFALSFYDIPIHTVMPGFGLCSRHGGALCYPLSMSPNIRLHCYTC